MNTKTSKNQSNSAVMTVREIEIFLQIGANSAYNLIHSKAFPVIRIGNSYRIPKDTFYDWFKQTKAVIF